MKNIIGISSAGLIVVMMVNCFSEKALADPNDHLILHWIGNTYTTNTLGKVVRRHFTERDFVKAMIVNEGISNASDVVLVYRPTKRDTAFVWKATGVFIADFIQMEYDMSEVTGSGSDTKGERGAFLFVEAFAPAIGHIAGEVKKGPDGFVNGRWSGTFSYMIAEENSITRGNFYTGKPLKNDSKSLAVEHHYITRHQLAQIE